MLNRQRAALLILMFVLQVTGAPSLTALAQAPNEDSFPNVCVPPEYLLQMVPPTVRGAERVARFSGGETGRSYDGALMSALYQNGDEIIGLMIIRKCDNEVDTPTPSSLTIDDVRVDTSDFEYEELEGQRLPPPDEDEKTEFAEISRKLFRSASQSVQVRIGADSLIVQMMITEASRKSADEDIGTSLEGILENYVYPLLLSAPEHLAALDSGSPLPTYDLMNALPPELFGRQRTDIETKVRGLFWGEWSRDRQARHGTEAKRAFAAANYDRTNEVPALTFFTADVLRSASPQLELDLFFGRDASPHESTGGGEITIFGARSLVAVDTLTDIRTRLYRGEGEAWGTPIRGYLAVTRNRLLTGLIAWERPDMSVPSDAALRDSLVAAVRNHTMHLVHPDSLARMQARKKTLASVFPDTLGSFVAYRPPEEGPYADREYVATDAQYPPFRAAYRVQDDRPPSEIDDADVRIELHVSGRQMQQSMNMAHFQAGLKKPRLLVDTLSSGVVVLQRFYGNRPAVFLLDDKATLVAHADGRISGSDVRDAVASSDLLDRVRAALNEHTGSVVAPVSAEQLASVSPSVFMGMPEFVPDTRSQDAQGRSGWPRPESAWPKIYLPEEDARWGDPQYRLWVADRPNRFDRNNGLWGARGKPFPSESSVPTNVPGVMAYDVTPPSFESETNLHFIIDRRLHIQVTAFFVEQDPEAIVQHVVEQLVPSYRSLIPPE